MRRFARPLALLLAGSLVLAHEATAQAPRARARRKPFAAFSESAQRLRDSLGVRLRAPAAPAQGPMLASISPFEVSLLRDSVLSVARSQLGTRYRLGAEAPGQALDCSSLIRYVMGALRLDLPRTAHEQSRLGREVARDTAVLRPGDLLTFGSRRHITHIGIYAGEGRVIHASTSQRKVVETTLASLGPSMLRRWRGVRRLIDVTDGEADAQ